MATKLPLGKHTFRLETTGAENNISEDSIDVHIEKNLNNLQRLNLPLQPSSARFEKLLDKEWPEINGEASICLWEDDKFAAASITIDDNIAVDHEWWINIGNQFSWKFTWFVTINYLYENSNNPYFGSWKNFQTLADLGHDIQSHTISHHPNDDTRADDEVIIEYLDAFNQINNKIKRNTALTISWPWGRFNREIGSLFAIAGRGVASSPNKPEQIDYLNVSSLDGNMSIDYIDSILTGSSAISRLGDNRYIRGWLVSFYHLVKDKMTVFSEFETLYQKSEDIWLGLFKDVARYGQERDTARLSTIFNTPSKIELELSDQMDDLLFNYPLTIKIKLYPNWQKIAATQANNVLKTNIIHHNQKTYALIKAVPDQGNIVIKPAER